MLNTNASYRYMYKNNLFLALNYDILIPWQLTSG